LSPTLLHPEPICSEGLTRNANRIFYFDEGLIATDEAHCESLSAGAEEPDHSGGMGMIRWPRRCEARPAINPRLLELEMANRSSWNFHANYDVEDMIQRRLERKWCEESWPNEEGMWPRGSACLNGQGLKLESVRIDSRDVSANWLKARRAIREGLTLYVPSLSNGPDRAHIAYILPNLIATSLLSPSHKDNQEKHGGSLHPQLRIF